MLYITKIDDSHDRRAVQHNAGISLLIKAVEHEYGTVISPNDIAYGSYGKPYLPCHPEICFNIAHCSGLAVCLISDKPCGVDAEKLRPISSGAFKRVFSPAESELIYSAPESSRDSIFTSLWTLKEAYAKADGRGLAAMSEAEFSFDGDNVISNTSLFFKRFFHEDHIISVCCSQTSDIKLNIC